MFTSNCFYIFVFYVHVYVSQVIVTLGYLYDDFGLFFKKDDFEMYLNCTISYTDITSGENGSHNYVTRKTPL